MITIKLNWTKRICSIPTVCSNWHTSSLDDRQKVINQKFISFVLKINALVVRRPKEWAINSTLNEKRELFIRRWWQINFRGNCIMILSTVLNVTFSNLFCNNYIHMAEKRLILDWLNVDALQKVWRWVTDSHRFERKVVKNVASSSVRKTKQE